LFDFSSFFPVVKLSLRQVVIQRLAGWEMDNIAYLHGCIEGLGRVSGS